MSARAGSAGERPPSTSARCFCLNAAGVASERAVAQRAFTLENKADLMLASTWEVHSAGRATNLMHRMGGTNRIYARSRLERHFRDAHTVRHHGFVSDSRLETVGQVISASRRSSHSWRSDRGI